MSKTNTMTPEEIHLGLYKRGEDESRGDATVVPRRIKITNDAVNKEVRQIVDMVNFVIEQNKATGEHNKIELQCTTAQVEKQVCKELGKEKLRHVTLLPPKVESIRGQYAR